jgi:hypothetical protein
MGTAEFDGLRADIRRDKSAAMLMQSWLPESALCDQRQRRQNCQLNSHLPAQQLRRGKSA